MPEEAGGEEGKDESEIEAEMLRMMEQEATGDSSEDEAPSSGDDSSDTGDESAMMDMMQAAMDEGQGAAPESDSDQMLEVEMLKAMQGDDAGGLTASLPGLAPPPEAEGVPSTLNRVLDVNVKMTVELGGNRVPIKDILTWGDGTMVELERMDREPVDVLVNGKLFARGEVVVVGETFGVKITELITTNTRG